MKKKGLSTVVTTLIIILLVLVAIGIIWVVIANVISQGSEQISIDKFTTNLKIESASVDNSTSSVDVDVKRNAGKGDLEGLKFIFNDGANSEISDQDNINLVELGERRFNFVLNNLNVDNVQTVSIAPIFKDSSGNKIYGGIVATYRIKGTTGVLGSCVPDCTGKICGSDGCEGTCSPGCTPGVQTCSDDQTQCIDNVNPCDLTSASWSATNVVEGNSVNLNAAGTQCTGTALNYSISDNTGVVDSVVVSTLTTSWTALYGSGNHQYTFNVKVVDNPSETITSSNQLTVAQATQTCAQLGGYICTGAQTCSGTLLPASDSSMCCSVTCTNPPTNPGVYRSFSSSTVSPGGSVTVTLQVLLGGATYYAIEEYVPSGWTVTADGGGLTNDPLTLKWANPSATTDTSYTYTVQAPSSTGTYTFDGIYQYEGMSSDTPTLGSTTVTVA